MGLLQSGKISPAAAIVASRLALAACTMYNVFTPAFAAACAASIALLWQYGLFAGVSRVWKDAS